MPIMRYPGGKSRIAQGLVKRMDLSTRSICEPFSGMAAVSLESIRSGLVDRVWLNDRDWGVASIWMALTLSPGDLCARIMEYTPVVSDFYEWKSDYSSDFLTEAFHTIALHQMSFSGLGRVAGSPIGGKEQRGKYPIGCRWNPDRIREQITTTANLLNMVEVNVTNMEWDACPREGWAWFVDPPYIDQGSGLYKYGLIDHARLAGYLNAATHPWVLTYDAADLVGELYPTAVVTQGLETYLNHGGAKRKRELIIEPTKQHARSIDRVAREA